MKLFTFKPIEGTDAVATVYLHDLISEMKGHRTEYPFVVVCPGGGYVMCSAREAEPIAMEYYSKGYNTVVLNYTVGENARKNYRPLKELAATIQKIRENAEEWHCKTDSIAICGFSAGGHLCGSMGSLWNNPVIFGEDKEKNEMHKPNAVILGYPAVWFGENVEITEENIAKYDFISVKDKITSETADTFIWQTVTDPIVKADTIIEYIAQLQEQGVTYECHFFPTGGHGLAGCNHEGILVDEHNRQWVDLSVNFLNKMFNHKP